MTTQDATAAWADEETASLGAITLESSHYVNVGSCGHVIAQCRCPDVDRPTHTLRWPCVLCQQRQATRRPEGGGDLMARPLIAKALLDWLKRAGLIPDRTKSILIEAECGGLVRIVATINGDRDMIEVDPPSALRDATVTVIEGLKESIEVIRLGGKRGYETMEIPIKESSNADHL